MLENHCTRTAESLRAGCGRQGHKIVYLAVKKGTIFVNTLLLKQSLLIIVTIYPVVYLLINIYANFAIADIAPELCQKGDFFPEKGDERLFFVYYLELMLT